MPTSRYWPPTWSGTQGEPVALVAADHPEVARRAAGKIVVDYEVLQPVTDPEAALDPGATALHPGGNLVRHLKIRKGDPAPPADVVVTGSYTIGMQDQAFLGPEAGLAVPDGDGGVDLYVSTQWLHVDQRQVCAALGLPPDRVRLVLAGVGGAFGGREDLSMHVHACLLALHTGKPVKMVYSREESFFGHVHRHPALMRYEHGANRDGTLVYVKLAMYLDGGAYASSTPAVVGNAGTMGAGPYVVPNVHIDVYGVYTNNPPCGAMRGFGSVQAAFGYEAQMDKLAAALGMDPVEFRCQNAMSMGSQGPTGQVVDSPAPVAELLRRVQRMPLPGRRGLAAARTCACCLAGSATPPMARASSAASVMRSATRTSGSPRATTTTRPRGYGLRHPAASRSSPCTPRPPRSARGWSPSSSRSAGPNSAWTRVVIVPKDTAVGSAGSTSASRQTYVTGGAVKAACEQVRERLLGLVQRQLGRTIVGLRLADGQVYAGAGGSLGPIASFLGGEVIEETVQWRHRPTEPIDPETGQGFAHVQYAFAAHRAVVDVDAELGLVKVVALDCAQDVGRAINPQAVVGQIQGGSRAGTRPGDHGGDPGPRRTDPESVLHRLPDPHHLGHPADADRRARKPRPARAVRRARRG